MKYLVDVAGARPDEPAAREVVEVAGGTARVGEAVAALAPADGSPLRTLRVGDEVYRVEVRAVGPRGRYALVIDGYRFEVEALDERARTIRDLTAASAGPAGPAPLVAPMPGLVVRVRVAVGDVVQPGEGLVVMEAMKMENELRTQAGGRVRAVLVEPGAAVEKGARLVELE